MSRRHAAQIVGGVVQRVIVADPAWAAQTLGGEWVETDKTGTTDIAYCGPGHGYDASFPERFASPWVMPSPDPETGIWSSYPKGSLVYHNGSLWRSTCDGNVWEPGISAWHPESDTDGVLPAWVQPTGAHDSYPMGFQVRHNNQDWYVTGVDANGHNVWEPGIFGWTIIGQDPEPGEQWVDTGATIIALAGQVYRLSAVLTGLTIGQPLRLGLTAETTFNGYWPTVGTPSDYIQITPYVSATVGTKVWKWA